VKKKPKSPPSVKKKRKPRGPAKPIAADARGIALAIMLAQDREAFQDLYARYTHISVGDDVWLKRSKDLRKSVAAVLIDAVLTDYDNLLLVHRALKELKRQKSKERQIVIDAIRSERKANGGKPPECKLVSHKAALKLKRPWTDNFDRYVRKVAVEERLRLAKAPR
jgi:hypothetical protein